MIVVNQKSVHYVDIFNRDDGVLTTPTYIRWKLKNLTHDQQIVQWTEIVVGLASEMTIQVNAGNNLIIDEDNDYERMILTVNKYFSDSSDEQYEDYYYVVKNLKEV